MNFAKRFFGVVFALLVFCFSETFAFSFDFLSFNKNDNKVDFSEIDTKRIIGITSGPLEDKWMNLFVNNGSEEELTAVSFLRQASIFDFWNYTLADLPADAVVNVLKTTAKGVFSEEKSDLTKTLLEKIEKVSVDKAIEIAKKELFDNQIKIASGAIRGMNSKENREVIFQYIIVYESTEDKKGDMTIRFYSTEAIYPPQSKASYGLALGFINSLENKEKLPPFVVELKGEAKEYLSGSYKFVSPVDIKITFSDNIPDLALVPTSWKDRYILSPIKEFINSIPIIGTLFNKGEAVEFLSGSGNEELINTQVSEIIEDKPIVADNINKADIKVEQKVIEDEGSKNAKKESKKTKTVSKNTNSKKTTIKTSEKKSKKEKESVDNSVFSEQQKKTYLISALKEYSDLLAEDEKTKKEEEERKVKELQKIEEKKMKEMEKEEKKKETAILAVQKKEKISKQCSRDNYSQNKRETIVFNEFAWMGDKESSSHEWIELKNIGSKNVDIEGWKIYSKDPDKDIVFEKSYIIKSGDFFILERSENSLKNIKADFLFGDSLSNSNEKFYLYDSECNIHDSVNAEPIWPAGSNTEKRTMEMAGDFTWHTYSGNGRDGIYGTPDAENSKYDFFVEDRNKKKIPNSVSSGVSSSGITTKSDVSYCNQDGLGSATLSPIVINEVSWMGSSVSSSDEWIELKNLINEDVSLSGWQLLDKNNDIKIVFGVNDKIKANGFYLIERTDDNTVPNIIADKIYSGSLSDKEESLRLFSSNCTLIDEATAQSSWPAGDGKNKKTMERKNNFAWQTCTNDSADDVSGLFGTPKKENSTEVVVSDENNNGTGEEEENEEENNETEEENSESENNEDDEELDSQFENLPITNFSITSGVSLNQVLLEWDKVDGASNYEIYYSIDGAIDESNLIRIDNYTVPVIFETSNKMQAMISDLYFGKKYFFAVKALNEQGKYSLLSQKLEENIETSLPILPFKDGNYTYSHRLNYDGTLVFSNSNISSASNLLFEGTSSVVIDANNNFYLRGKKDDKYGIFCLDSSGDLKWFFELSQGGDPFIGIDGTIYFNNSANLFALSPSGVLKWKEKFVQIISKDPLMDQNGDIYVLALSVDTPKGGLFKIADSFLGAEVRLLFSFDEVFTDKIFASYSEIAIDSDQNLYFGIDNNLIKYERSSGEVKNRTIAVQCSLTREGACGFMPVIEVVSVVSGKVYVSIFNAYIGDTANFNGVYILNASNIEDDNIVYVNNTNFSGADDNGFYGYHTYYNIFSQGSSVSYFDGETGLQKWTKTWKDAIKRLILMIDENGVVYIKGNNQIVGYDSTDISSEKAEDDVVYQLNLTEGDMNASISENVVYFTGKNIKKLSR